MEVSSNGCPPKSSSLYAILVLKPMVTWGSRMLRTPTCTANSGCIGFRCFHRDSVFVAGGVRQARPSAGAGDQCGEGRNRAARYPMGYLMVRI